MRHAQRLERIARELRRRQNAPAARPAVQVIEVYCEGVLVEVRPLGAAAPIHGELSQPIPSSSASSPCGSG